MDYPRPSRLSEPLGRLHDLTDIYGHSIPGQGPAWGVVAAADARGPIQQTSTRSRKSDSKVMSPIQPQYFPGRPDLFESSIDQSMSQIKQYSQSNVTHETSEAKYRRRMEDVTNRSVPTVIDRFMSDAGSHRSQRVEMAPRENFSPGIAISGSMRGQYTK